MSNHIYFKGLNFIRFTAASLVVIHHIEQFKDIFGLPNLWTNNIIRNMGDKGVTLFFVLSGFLITFLLLKEKEKTHSIHIRYFYIRRILRIWPLYFIIVLSSIFLFPHIPFFRMDGTSIIENNFTYVLLLSVLILPNITLLKFGSIPFSSQTWSIGVEEQFYLVWPLIIKYVKHIYALLITIILLLFLLQNNQIVVTKLFGQNFTNPNTPANIAHFFKFFRIDCMAFGSIGALLVFNKSKFLHFIYKPVSSILILVLSTALLLNPIKIYVIDNLIHSITFTALIINVATYTNCKYTIENKFFNILGNISYGIYMYHPIICFSIIKLLGEYLNNFFIYLLTFTFTCITAYASYMLIEKKLIKKKTKKFSVIKSN